MVTEANRIPPRYICLDGVRGKRTDDSTVMAAKRKQNSLDRVELEVSFRALRKDLACNTARKFTWIPILSTVGTTSIATF